MGARGANTFSSCNRIPYLFSLVVRPLFCFMVCWHSLPFQDKYVSGDSVDFRGSDTMRELFFLYAMLHHDVLNAAAFVADFLGKVGRASSSGISVGGLITQIAVHFGYKELLDTDTPIAGKTKIDMESLIHQSMITISNGGY